MAGPEVRSILVTPVMTLPAPIVLPSLYFDILSFSIFWAPRRTDVHAV